jgi:hypothetical protein
MLFACLCLLIGDTLRMAFAAAIHVEQGNTTNTSEKSFTDGELAGIIVGSIVATAIVAGCVAWCCLFYGVSMIMAARN